MYFKKGIWLFAANPITKRIPVSHNRLVKNHANAYTFFVRRNKVHRKGAIKMNELYQKLFSDCSNIEAFPESSHFVSMRGQNYGKEPKRFMLIGRAVNGWGSLPTESAQAFGLEAQRQFDNLERWNWITEEHGVLYSIYKENGIVKKYCIDQKPFWSYTKPIWAKIQGATEEQTFWMKNIVWSNLYKASPLTTGNPNPELIKAQQASCKEILRRELEFLKPTHILVISGFDWFQPFAELFHDVTDTGERNVLRGDNKNAIYVEGTASFQNAKVVITCRPEWRDKNGFVDAVVEAFSNL